MFGKKSDAVKKAEDQYRIQRLKNKAEAERLKNLAKEERIKARSKNGGVGGSFAFVDRRDIPEPKPSTRKGRR